MNDDAARVEPVHQSKKPRGRAFWIAMFLVAAVVIAVLVVSLFPPRSSAKDAAKCNACANNMKQIGLAILNYQDSGKVQVPAYTVDTDGKRLHSWRVLLLPYLEEKELSKLFKLDEPFDSAHNRELAGQMPDYFRCPFEDSTSQTSYFLVTKNGKVGECKIDGEKILLIEVPDRKVNWLSPYGDVECNEIPAIRARIKEMGHPQGIGVIMVDGSFRRLTE